MVLLVEISLLSSNLFSKKIGVDNLFELIICFFFLFGCFDEFVEGYSIFVDLSFDGFVREELSIELLLRSIHFKFINQKYVSLISVIILSNTSFLLLSCLLVQLKE